MSDPPISVVMTAYNGRAYIGEAIRSVLAQSWEDFELVIVEDASTDDTLEIIRGFEDKRIRVLPNERNLGISNSRNRGIAAARGRYLAAHDQDDLSLPHRLARHIEVMESQPDVVLTAGRVSILPRTQYIVQPLLAGQALAWSLFTRSPIIHSSICLRQGALGPDEPFYRQEYHYAEDFELYHRLSEVGRLVIVPEEIGVYRFHDANTSRTRREAMLANAQRFLHRRYSEYLGEDFVSTDDMASLIRVCVCSESAVSFAELDRLGVILDALVSAFLARRHVEGAEREAVFAEASHVWWRVVRSAALALGPRAFDRYRAYGNLSRGEVPLIDRAKALAKSLISAGRLRLRPS